MWPYEYPKIHNHSYLLINTTITLSKRCIGTPCKKNKILKDSHIIFFSKNYYYVIENNNNNNKLHKLKLSKKMTILIQTNNNILF